MLKKDSKVYEESRKLPAQGARLEVKSYFSLKEAPSLVIAPGLGGKAQRDYLTQGFAREFNVKTLSPRNSGGSTGNFTVTNYLLDIKNLVDDVSQKDGEAPYGVGHSTGGYALARLMADEDLFERSLLLAPLLELGEQNPTILNKYLRYCVENDKLPIFTSNGRNISSQRFSEEDVLPFLESLYSEKKCDSSILSPTKVVLAKGSTLFVPISNLDELKEEWERLGAEVEIYKGNHWFSSPLWFMGEGDFARHAEKTGLIDGWSNWLKGNTN